MASKIIATDTIKDQFIAHFRPVSPNGIAWGQNIRTRAESALAKLDVPTTKWEAWKYTSVKPLVSECGGKGGYRYLFWSFRYRKDYFIHRCIP